MFEEAAKTSGPGSSLQWWLPGRARAWAILLSWAPAEPWETWQSTEKRWWRWWHCWCIHCVSPQNSRQGFLCTWGPGWDFGPCTFPFQGRILCPTPTSLEETSLISTSAAGGTSWISFANSVSDKMLHTSEVLLSKHGKLNSQKLQICHCRTVFPTLHCHNIFVLS